MSSIPFILLAVDSRIAIEKNQRFTPKEYFYQSNKAKFEQKNYKMSTPKSAKDDRVYENSNMVRRNGLSCVFI